MKIPMWYDSSEPTRAPNLKCCRPIKKQYANSQLSITPIPTITVAIAQCKQKINQIVSYEFSNGPSPTKVVGCRYYDGGYRLDWPYVICTTRYTTDLAKCNKPSTTPGATIGLSIKDQVAKKCYNLKDLLVVENSSINFDDDIRFNNFPSDGVFIAKNGVRYWFKYTGGYDYANNSLYKYLDLNESYSNVFYCSRKYYFDKPLIQNITRDPKTYQVTNVTGWETSNCK